MKKKLYFTVEKELSDVDGIQETTGHKTVTVYEIENNEPKKFFDLDLTSEQNTKEEIGCYLEDNGYGDEEFELIWL